MGYTGFDKLPFSGQYGDRVRNERGEPISVRCTLIRTLNRCVHRHVRDVFSMNRCAPAASVAHETSQSYYDREREQGESYGDAATEVLYYALQVNPVARLSVKKLMRFEFFTKPCPAVVSLGGGGAYHTANRSEFEKIRMENVVPLVRYLVVNK
jgi:hypothetical protein